MKKSIFLFFAAILFSASAWAGWCGNSFITVNGLWYTGSNSYVHNGGKFHGKDLGTLTTLELGGEFQVWPSSSTAGTLCYKIDNGTENSISLPKTGTDGSNSKHSGSGAVDLSGLAGGSHSIAVWFKHGSDTDNNGGNNFVATFTIAAATPDPEPEPEPEPIADVTVHFINSVEWAEVACHHWIPEGAGTSWPGDVLSKTDEIAGYDVYTATFTGAHTSCIFNNNNNGNQTSDLTVEDGKYYEVNTDTWYADKAAAEAALATPIPDETVYLINTGNWSKAMIHTWNGVGGTTWPGVEMTLTGETIEGYAVYSYTAKQGGQANLLFQESENVNKTGDLTWEAGKYYAPLKNEWYDTKEAAAEALAAPVVKTYTVVGSSAPLFGEAWATAKTENDMTLVEGTKYELVKTDVSLTVGEIQYKVAVNHAWDEAYPAENAILNISEAGKYTVTFTFDSNTKAVNATAELTEAAVVLPTVGVKGAWDGWATTTTLTGDNTSASATVNIATAGVYEFGLDVDGDFQASGATIDKANNSTVVTTNAGNMKLTANVLGDYTFTWTYETKTLTVSYPVLPIYTVTVAAENGTVEDLAADGKYEHGATATLTAAPAEGYHFVNWTVGGKEVSAKNPYEFTVTENVDLVANFAKNVYTVKVTAENGTVAGDGEYTHGEQATLTATSAEGYEFVNWTKGEEVVSTANPYTITVTENVTLVANFKEAEPEYQVIEDEITNFVFDTEAWPMVCYGGPSEEYAIEVYLVLTEAADGTLSYEDCSVSINGTDATFIEGTLSDLDVYAPSADAVLRVQWNGEFYELRLAMSAAAAPVEPITIEIDNATVAIEKRSMGFGDEVYYVLSMDATWSDGETTYPVSLETTEFDQTKDSQEVAATITVGGWEDDDPWLGNAEGEVTITVVNNVVTVAGLLENPWAWPAPVAFDFIISGTLPSNPTALDNVEVSASAVKAIENGQLIIVKDGVQYNAQGAILK